MTSLNGFGRRRWSSVAAGALVLVLAACGSQAKTVEVKKPVPPSPRKVLLASARATTAAKSARLSMKMSANGSGADGFAITADGVADFTSGDAALTMQVGGSRQFGGIEARLVDGEAYMKMPASLGSMFGGAQWMKLPVGAPVGVLPGFDQSDPSKFLAYLETVSNGVKKIGSEPIRGVDTTHYEATFDLGKAIDNADVPASLRDELGKLFHKNGASSKIPADVWVDDGGLVRRIQMTLDLGRLTGEKPEGDAPMVMTMSIDLYDFGIPVHVQAPPPGDVQDFPNFGPSGSSGTFGAPA
jgi:hypothetical protein